MAIWQTFNDTSVRYFHWHIYLLLTRFILYVPLLLLGPWPPYCKSYKQTIYNQCQKWHGNLMYWVPSVLWPPQSLENPGYAPASQYYKVSVRLSSFTDSCQCIINCFFLFSSQTKCFLLCRIASGGWDKRLIVWDIQTGTILVWLCNMN